VLGAAVGQDEVLGAAMGQDGVLGAAVGQDEVLGSAVGQGWAPFLLPCAVSSADGVEVRGTVPWTPWPHGRPGPMALQTLG